MEIYGWLAPSGNFFKTEMYAHLQAIGEHSELKALVSDLMLTLPMSTARGNIARRWLRKASILNGMATR